jgi:hypothetical protein
LLFTMNAARYHGKIPFSVHGYEWIDSNTKKGNWLVSK